MTLTFTVPALAVAAMALPAVSQEVSAEELTRRLNGGPPKVQAAPVQSPAVLAPSVQATPVRVNEAPVTQVQAATPVADTPAGASTPEPQTESEASSLTRSLNNRPAVRAVATPTPTRAPVPAALPVSTPAPERVPASPVAAPEEQPVVRQEMQRAAEVVQQAPARRVEGPQPLSAQAIASLPFRIDLYGAEIIERPAGSDGKVYSVRSGPNYLLMIYAGSQSQFPLYDGERAHVAGRYTTVVTQDGKRMAAEHLFRREEAQPVDIHIWLMSLDGENAVLAERIGQSVDPR